MTQQQVLEYLQKTYPDYDFRSGYIGNVGWCGNKYIDDRSFRIWCDDVQETLWSGHVQSISIRLGSREDIENRSDQEWILLLMYAVKYIERMAQKEMDNA
jgi:hypothetical protein